MPGLGTRNNVRSARSFAAKLVADCEPKTRKKREAELTTALNNFATMYQKLTNSVNGADWHVHFVKVLEDNKSPANANNANNAVNAANVNSTALVNSNAMVKGNAAIVNNAVNTVNAANANTNNTKRPADAMNQDGNNGDASNASKRVKAEDAHETTFKVVSYLANTGYTATVYNHEGNKSHEFALNGPAVVHVHTGAGTPTFAQPAVPATSTSANAQADGNGSHSARPVSLDMR
ncbi:hypothetical protein B0H65DRAFT_547087 [Neurospora tetraspora]|uniref:Uncharacterized protein n=1 Tax=Neurospora tetraspora TaxID=94610 RepID=A0AAE0JM65_9PEZI|nr:hypothetical protein B0H65DRAFT_547087 [Neurospora tetraspora]